VLSPEAACRVLQQLKKLKVGSLLTYLRSLSRHLKKRLLHHRTRFNCQCLETGDTKGGHDEEFSAGDICAPHLNLDTPRSPKFLPGPSGMGWTDCPPVCRSVKSLPVALMAVRQTCLSTSGRQPNACCHRADFCVRKRSSAPQPKLFESYVGQTKVRKDKSSLAPPKRRGEALDHVLLFLTGNLGKRLT
jgi:hypothetical protein